MYSYRYITNFTLPFRSYFDIKMSGFKITLSPDGAAAISIELSN